MNSEGRSGLGGRMCLLPLALVGLLAGNGVAAAYPDVGGIDTEVAAAVAASTSTGIASFQAGPSLSGLPRYSEPQFILRVSDADSYEPALTSGDFNDDGLDDVVITRTDSETTQTFELDILLNDGNGSLILSTSSVFSGTVPQVRQPAAMRLVVDLNGDESPDFFVPDQGLDVPPHPGHQNTLVLSAPGGKLVDATANLPQLSDVTFSAAAGDIDGDGDNDLYLGNIWGRSMIDPQILLNDGSGRFTVAENRLPASLNLTQNGYTASEFVDVNNDGFPELVLGDAGDTIDNTLSTTGRPQP